jgi:hypothetical protein
LTDRQAARDLAAALVSRLRDSDPGALTAGPIDIGPALEQQLYFAVRDGVAEPSAWASVRDPLTSSGLVLAAMGAALVPRPRPHVDPGGVLLVVRQPVHVRIYRPVRAALRDLGGPPTTVARVSAAASATDVAATGPRIEAFLDRRAFSALVGGDPRYEAAWEGVDAGIPVTALARLARRLRPRLVAAAASLLSAVSRTRPAVVATYDEVGSWGRLVAEAARSAGVPSLDLPHAEAADPIGTRGATYDRMAVFGPVASDRLRQAGIADERIVEVGAPNFDELVAAAAQRRTPDARQILVTSQYTAGTMTPEVKERTLRAAVAAAAPAAPCTVVIRPHPTEHDDLLDRIAAEPAPDGVRVSVDRSGTLRDLLLRSWIMITGSSQTVLEAAVVGIPSISINATGGEDPVTYAAEGIALGATDAATATEQVRRMLDRGSADEQVARARTALERHIGPLDGRAAERTARLILGLARREESGG